MRFLIASLIFLAATATAQPVDAKLRIGVVGLVHGHVAGFFRQALHRDDVEIVGIAEPDAALGNGMPLSIIWTPSSFIRMRTR